MLKDLKEGNRATERVLIKSIDERDGQSGAYFHLDFSDGETDMSANAFRLNRDLALSLRGKVADIDIKQKNGYINVDSIRVVEDEDPSRFLAHAPINIEMGMTTIYSKISSIQDDALREVTEYLVRSNEDRFCSWAAGKSMHHDCLQGLLYHVCRMLISGEYICRVYTSLDYGLMVAGIILHDIGKLQEMVTDEFGVTEYTVEGNLFGHLYLGPVMIDDACRDLGIDPKAERIMLLRHMIVSHHKTQEQGAIRTPAIAEAYALAMLDDLDSRMWMFEKETLKIDPGTVTDNKVKGLDTYLYRRLHS